MKVIEKGSSVCSIENLEIGDCFVIATHTDKPLIKIDSTHLDVNAVYLEDGKPIYVNHKWFITPLPLATITF